jgi:hypothetical protein
VKEATMQAIARSIACTAILWLTLSAASAGTVDANSWRPYRDRDTLVMVGMTTGEVQAKAGRPDHTEVIAAGTDGRPTTSAWIYMRMGQDGEVASLIFRGNELVKIELNAVP